MAYNTDWTVCFFVGNGPIPAVGKLQRANILTRLSVSSPKHSWIEITYLYITTDRITYLINLYKSKMRFCGYLAALWPTGDHSDVLCNPPSLRSKSLPTLTSWIVF